MKESVESRIYHILSIIFGLLAISLLIVLYSTYPEESTVGERFVWDQLIFPTPLYTFHFKPITLYVMFGFLWWALGLEAWRRYISKMPKLAKRLIIVFLSLGAFIMSYEFLQNFLMWTSFYILYGGNIDQLAHQLNPAMPRPVNFNFVSKLFGMLLAGALYGIYFFTRLDDKG